MSLREAWDAEAENWVRWARDAAARFVALRRGVMAVAGAWSLDPIQLPAPPRRVGPGLVGEFQAPKEQ